VRSAEGSKVRAGAQGLCGIAPTWQSLGRLGEVRYGLMRRGWDGADLAIVRSAWGSKVRAGAPGLGWCRLDNREVGLGK